MAYLFPIFFGVLAVALIAYLVMAVRERLKPIERVECTLETRMREKFPNQTLLGRRDKVDYTLIFRTSEGNRIPVAVTKEIYKSIPKEASGVLCHRGSIFLSFSFQGKTVQKTRF